MRSFARLSFLILLWVTVSVQAAQFGTDRFVEYRPGELPLVFTSPHGGSLTPATIPDRKEGVTTKDVFTQELTLAISDALHAATGRRPHLILSHLHRRKLDPNREIKEAAAGQPPAERAWREFHDFIRAANAAAVAQHGFAFLVDIHGHAHPIPRVEVGYTLNNVQLNRDDRTFDASDLASLSTLRDLHARRGGSGADLIRGPRSLGTLFADRGVRAVPSRQEPQPGSHPYFSGGYIVQAHARDPATPKVDGVQFEHQRDGLRDTAEHRARYAAVVAEVLQIFLRENYRYEAGAARPGR